MVASWGTHLGEGALEDGVDACITSWNRLAPNTMPGGVKAGGNYLSSQLIGFEAMDRGFAEGIALGVDGLLSEGGGRERVPRPRRADFHSAGIFLHPRRNHPRHGDQPGR